MRASRKKPRRSPSADRAAKAGSGRTIRAPAWKPAEPMRLAVLCPAPAIALALQELAEADGPSAWVVRVHTEPREQLRAILKAQPHVLIADSRACAVCGGNCVYKLHAMAPALPILLLGGDPKPSDLFQWVAGGVRGYLPMPRSLAELRDAITRLARGEDVFDAQAAGALADALRRISYTALYRGLSLREREVLPLT